MRSTHPGRNLPGVRIEFAGVQGAAAEERA